MCDSDLFSGVSTLKCFAFVSRVKSCSDSALANCPLFSIWISLEDAVRAGMLLKFRDDQVFFEKSAKFQLAKRFLRTDPLKMCEC